MMYGDWYEHQGHPHHHHIHGDMEPAFVVRPGDDCCPDPTAQQCECVTSGDIEKWNNAADTVDSLTGIDITAAAEALTSITGLTFSADYWNSTYETVCAYSADWEHVRDLSSFSADTVEHLTVIDDALSSLNTDVCAISAAIPHLYFDNDPWSGSITGDGTEGSPYGIKNFIQYKNLRSDFDKLASHVILIPPADKLGERYIFDGDLYYLEKVENEYQQMADTIVVEHSKQLDLHTKEIAQLMNEKAEGKDLKTYLGSDTIKVIEKPGAARGTEYTIHVTDIPKTFKDKIEIGETALKRVKALEAKNYVEFIKTNKPSTTADIVNLTANKTIYYC